MLNTRKIDKSTLIPLYLLNATIRGFILAGVKKNRYQSCIQIFVCIILILSIIQIFPDDVKIIHKASASSTWEDTNWSAPENYSSFKSIDIIPSSGDLKLHYGRILYLADFTNDRIVKTTMDGSFWTTFGTSGTGIGQFKYPSGISYDSTGYIYVVDVNNNRIVKTMMNGSGWSTCGTMGNGTRQFNNPNGINYDSSTGYIYVADTLNDRIVKTMMNGSGWCTYGTSGSGTGQFNRPAGIDYDSSTGYIYVSDIRNNRIIKTMMNGTGWTTLGSYGNGVNQFYYPYSISYNNSTGFIYVTDTANHRIVKTKIDGSGWTTYGTKGSGSGQFNSPMGIEYDNSTGDIYVTDSYNYRIVKTKMNGSGWTTYGAKGSGYGQFDWPYGITLSENNYFPNGYLISKKYNLSSPADLLTLSWVADTPQDTNIKFQLRSAPDQSALENKDFVGPNGSTNRFYNKTDVNIWNGHNSDSWAQYKVYLTTSNVSRTPVLKDVKIVYNLLPNQPTLISPSDNAWTNDNETTFTWNFNDMDSNSQSEFQLQLDNDKSFNTIDYDSNIIASLQSTHKLTTPLADGIWYWRVRTEDDEGGWGPFSSPWKILIDTKPPKSEITLPQDNTFYKKLDSIRGTAIDPEVFSGVNRTEITIKRMADNSYWDGTTWSTDTSWLLTSGYEKWVYNTSTVTWTSGLRFSIQTRSTDNVTNQEIPGEGVVFNYDIDRPVSMVEEPQNNSYHNSLDIITGSSYDIGGSGVKKVEISIKNLIHDKYWNGKNWITSETWRATTGNTTWSYDSTDVLWDTGNEYMITSKATDNVDVIEIPNGGSSFIFDIDGPLSQVIYPGKNSYLNKVESIYGNATDIGGSGIENVSIAIKRKNDDRYWTGSSWASHQQWLFAEGTEEWIYDASEVDWTTDNYYLITPLAADKAGNPKVSEPGNSFMYDDQPPEQSLVINNNNEFTNSEVVELSLEYDDSGSGVALMAVSNNNVEWSDWESINTIKKYNFTSGDGDGEKVVYFKVQDRAGNIAESVIDSIILDTYPPEGSMIINEGAIYTTVNQISLSLTAVDNLSGVDQMAFSFDRENWTTWKPFNQNEKLSLPTGDGNKTVYLRIKDKAGNICIVADSIVLDTKPPHSLSIFINNNAKETESKKVMLSLTAFDETSGVHEMAFSSDGINWSDWEDFSKTASIDLSSGYGEKIIYFKVMDRAGNIALPVIDTITLNNPRSEIKSDSTGTDMFWLFILVIIIVIVITISVANILYNRRKRAKETISTQNTAIIEPVDLSVPTTTIPQLASAAAHTSVQPQLQTTTAQATSTPQIAQVQQLPQLPPAQASRRQSEVSSTTLVPTASDISSEPLLPMTQPQQNTQPTGPEVHLPDSPITITTIPQTTSETVQTQQKASDQKTDEEKNAET
jgi:hypothetical protein